MNCQALTGKGHDCPFKAKNKGLCGHHQTGGRRDHLGTFGVFLRQLGLIGLGEEDIPGIVNIDQAFGDARVITKLHAKNGDDSGLDPFKVSRILYNDKDIIIYLSTHGKLVFRWYDGDSDTVAIAIPKIPKRAGQNLQTLQKRQRQQRSQRHQYNQRGGVAAEGDYGTYLRDSGLIGIDLPEMIEIYNNYRNYRVIADLNADDGDDTSIIDRYPINRILYDRFSILIYISNNGELIHRELDPVTDTLAIAKIPKRAGQNLQTLQKRQRQQRPQRRQRHQYNQRGGVPGDGAYGTYLRARGLVGMGEDDLQEMIEIYNIYRNYRVIVDLNADDGDDTSIDHYPIRHILYDGDEFNILIYISNNGELIHQELDPVTDTLAVAVPAQALQRRI